ncbi:MAG: amidase, partial [Salinimicrobium sp.]
MKQFFVLLLLCLVVISCKEENKEETAVKEPAVVWKPNDESLDLEKQAKHENERMRFKLINSKYLDKNDLWKPFEKELSTFSSEKYESLKPLVLEKSIPELQQEIKHGKLTYEDLTLFYIYRIRKFESDNELSLNAVIALNPDVVEEARKLDERNAPNVNEHSVYGMPILLKDNI